MKTELEQQDIQLIAERVAETLKPLLNNNRYTEDDMIFTPETLAEYLKVEPSWVYKQASQKTIPHFKPGKYLRFKKSLIDKWIKSQSIEPLPPYKIPNKMKAAS